MCSYQRIQRCKEDFYKNSIKNGSGDYYGDFLKPGGIELVPIDTSGHDDSWSAIEGDRSTAMLVFLISSIFRGYILNILLVLGTIMQEVAVKSH